MTYRAQIFVVHPNTAKRTEIAGMLKKMIGVPDVSGWRVYTGGIGIEIEINEEQKDFINWMNSDVVHPAFKKVIPDSRGRPNDKGKGKGKPDIVNSGRRGRNVDNSPKGKRKKLLSEIRNFVHASYVPIEFGGEQYRDQRNRLGLKEL